MPSFREWAEIFSVLGTAEPAVALYPVGKSCFDASLLRSFQAVFRCALLSLSVSLVDVDIIELDGECDVPAADATVTADSESAATKATDILVVIWRSFFGSCRPNE